jgi:hypothetical protein
MGAMMVTLIYYGEDGSLAQALAEVIRAAGGKAYVRHAYAFDGQKEHCDRVVPMADVSEWQMARLRAVYGKQITATADAPPAVETPPAGNVAEMAPAPEAMTVTELRNAIARRTGKKPSLRVRHADLVAALKAAGGI